MIGNAYGLRYVPTLSKTGGTGNTAEFIYDADTNRYGLLISGWRHSYDSNVAINNALNAVLESFYFFCGDKTVAKSICKWICRHK
jgi:hypothetical protein